MFKNSVASKRFQNVCPFSRVKLSCVVFIEASKFSIAPRGVWSFFPKYEFFSLMQHHLQIYFGKRDIFVRFKDWLFLPSMQFASFCIADIISVSNQGLEFAFIFDFLVLAIESISSLIYYKTWIYNTCIVFKMNLFKYFFTVLYCFVCQCPAENLIMLMRIWF